MKTLVSLGIFYLFTCIGVSQACLSLGWEDDYRHTNGETILKKSPKITVVKREGEFIFIKVENNTGEDLIYDGYSKNDPPCFFKTKTHERRGVVEDAWAATYFDRHWGGISQYVITDGRSVTFKVKPMVKPCQIFVRLRSKADKKRFSFVKIYEE